VNERESHLRSVTVYIPGGAGITFPGAECSVMLNPNTGAAVIEHVRQDGSRQRFVGLPFSVELEPPSAIVAPGGPLPKLRAS